VGIDPHDHVDDPVSGNFGECMWCVRGNDDHVTRSDLAALSIQDFWSCGTGADKPAGIWRGSCRPNILGILKRPARYERPVP
jgi:hypothetical protein